MAAVEFRLYFDNEAADQKRLDQVDSIVVEQKVDMAWEARLSIPVCVNGDGKWEGEDEAWMKPFKRVRVEIKVGSGDFVALIDGPIVGHDNARSMLPGKSMVTLVVHDDSALLHRQHKISRFSGSDSEIARQIFEAAQLGAPPDIDDTASRSDTPFQETMQSGTDMQMLRTLARRNPSWHAYVLPGSQPGQSIGCFKRLPTKSDGLPALVLMGDGRNLANFDLRNNARSPASVQGATLSLKDKKIVTASASYRNAILLGDEPAVPEGSGDTVRQLPPGQSGRNDLDDVAAGVAADSGFSAEATGSLLPLCYGGILSPYRAVNVQLSDSAQSGLYVIFKVTHTLTRSDYTQSFTVRGNAISAKSSTSASKPQASASFSASFNVQVSIF
jgi:hypothetical protein